MTNIDSGQELLNTVYRSLGYNDGLLLQPVLTPTNGSIEHDSWVEKGDWLTLGAKLGLDRIFFVNNDPVLVFCNLEKKNDLALMELFRRVWCMAQPQCLFVAMEGELQIYSLKQQPARDSNEWKNVKVLDTVFSANEVAEKLNTYRRENIESGVLFQDERFGSLSNRADKQLIQDLKTIRRELIKNGLKERYVHSLIGRSIFIRYLEDREILTYDYFKKIADGNNEWLSILASLREKPDFGPIEHEIWYDKVLMSKSFTYSLFERLSIDFNGDMFPQDKEEKESVDETNHLRPLRQFLLGDADIGRPQLFFWAYDFKIIPTELISNIYEEFYHINNDDDDKGTHYTPTVLVEYMMNTVLTRELLAKTPKILDPACGSGIFLVEAFRRIVRFQTLQKGRFLLPAELRTIMREQIWGIEINEEAVQIAAFSLYLALLNYQEPPNILASKRLPNLIYKGEDETNNYNFNILYQQNAFALTPEEKDTVYNRLYGGKKFKGRNFWLKLYHSDVRVLPLQLHSFDIVVGNPPWGFKKSDSEIPKVEQEQVLNWCQVFQWTIGDKELSQAFIARAHSFLKPTTGHCGLLISSGVVYKHHANSKAFRERWLSENTILAFVSFLNLRNIFFNANAPFAFIHFVAIKPDLVHRLQYWSAKRTTVVEKTQRVILNQCDIQLVLQQDLKESDYLWKVYWWGNNKDASLIRALKFETTLGQLAEERGWITGRGFQGDYPGGEHQPSKDLKRFLCFPTKYFQRYGSLPKQDFTSVPEFVNRYGTHELYSGWRLLMGRGITQEGSVKGRIEARVESDEFCFHNSIHGVKLSNTEDWERKIILATLWSSLARYFFFMTASSWGTWHYEIHLEELLTLPIRWPKTLSQIQKVSDIVDALQHLKEPFTDLEVQDLEVQLDDVIFDIFELNRQETQIIIDGNKYYIDSFYNPGTSLANKPVILESIYETGLLSSLVHKKNKQELDVYLQSFLEIWNNELEPDGQFSWRIIKAPQVPMLAIVFTTIDGEVLSDEQLSDVDSWNLILSKLNESLRMPVSNHIYIDGLVRGVTDTEIFIIKRDERRLWSPSRAYEDAEATLLQAMQLQGGNSVNEASPNIKA